MPHSNGFAEIRARKALQESGLPHDGPLKRADSTSNEVFVACNHVVRFNQRADQRLKREAAIYDVLPDRSWKPEVVAYGGRLGADYLIVARRPGVSLSRIWPQLSTEQRRNATRQLTQHLKDLHQVPNCRRLPDVESPPHMIGGHSPVAELLEGIDRLATLPSVDPGLAEGARELVHTYGDSLDDYHETALIHGDFTLENVLWDGEQVTAIIDFEWCRGGPADLDLDILGRYFAIPQAHVSAEAERWQHTEDYFEVPTWMSEIYPELFDHPRLADRLLIYALAFEVRDVLDNPPVGGKRDLDELHPYYRLDHLVATGGHVEELISHLGRPFDHC